MTSLSVKRGGNSNLAASSRNRLVVSLRKAIGPWYLFLCVGVVLSLPGGHPLAWQSPEFDRLLKSYRGIDAEGAIRELATWPDARVLQETFPQDDLWTLASAALFNLETALAGAEFRRDDEGVNADRLRWSYIKVGAGLVERILSVESRTKDPDLQAFCRDWYLTVQTIEPSNAGGWGLDTELLPSMRRLLGDDPLVYLFLGAKNARAIGPARVGDGPYAVGSEFDTKGRRILTIAADGETYNADAVRAAESAFRKSIALNPDVPEAHLRLGRLLQLTNRKKPAQEEFLHILSSPIAASDTFTPYLAALFLGKTYEDQGRIADAQASYRDAITRYSAGTSARLALAQALTIGGMNAEGLTEARSAFGPEVQPTALDPWSRFPTAQYGQVTARLSAMRSKVSATPLQLHKLGALNAELAGRPGGGPIPTPPTVTSTGDRPMFKGVTDGVRVEAVVTDSSGTPLTGLSAADFVLTDSGSRQEVGSAAVASSLSLAVVIDSSQSVSMPGADAQIRRVTDTISAAVKPQDLVSIISASDRLRLRADLVHGPGPLAEIFGAIRPQPRTGTAIWDAAIAASALVADAPGRAFVVIVSDGYDNSSWFERRDALNRLKRIGVPVDGFSVSPDSLALRDGRDIAFGDVSLRPLESFTGGVTFAPDDPRLATKIRDRFEVLRQSYVLLYSPKNAKPQKDGWHDIKVSLRPGLKGRVDARPGYYELKKR